MSERLSRARVLVAIVSALASTSALATGCGSAACPEGFVQIEGACTLPPDAATPLDASGPGPGDDAFVVEGPRDGGADAPLPDAFLATDGCTPSTFYVDADGDGFGNAALSIASCEESVAGYSRDATDCDDDCASCHPGGTETCDGRDNDCAGGVDDGVLSTFWADCDRDGATAAGAMTVQACATPSSGPAACPSGGWATSASAMPDCDDACAVCFPGNTEVCDDRDNDCDVAIDEGVRTTYVADCDRDDYTPAGATTVAACTAPSAGPPSCPTGGWRVGASSSADCNDDCASCHPGGVEICDGLDQDCVLGVDNGVLVTFYRDCDGDTYTAASPMTTQACTRPTTAPPGCPSGAWRDTASVAPNLDCWDGDANARPGQTAYFTSGATGRSTLPYDYDCNGTEERGLTSTGGTCPAATTNGICGVTGWSGTTIPACTASATYIECYRGSFMGITGHYTCSGTTSSRHQECR